MLKIRDSVDLKELEKFGYRLGQDDGCHEAYIKDLKYNDYIAIYEDGRILIDVEKWVSEIYKDLKPFFDLVEKNKKIIDKYCKRKDKEDE